MQAPFSRADESLPIDPAFARKTLIVVGAPIEPMMFYMHYARATRGAVLPARTRLLATGSGELVVERLDARTLRVSSASGLLSRAADMMMRSPQHDLPRGAEVTVAGMQVTIDEI